MTHRKAPGCTETLNGLSALLLLALGTSMSPALAATSADTRCDQSVGSPEIPIVHHRNLTLEVVDHGSTSAVEPGQLSVDGAIEDGGSKVPAVDERPRVETLLRRIFDEPQLRTTEAPPAEDADGRSVPFAVDKSENVEKPAATAPEDEASDIAPSLPGVSSDELLRLKQQMYRTDI